MQRVLDVKQHDIRAVGSSSNDENVTDSFSELLGGHYLGKERYHLVESGLHLKSLKCNLRSNFPIQQMYN